MADAGLVDVAVMEVLANDATLAGLCPDGVFYGLAPDGLTAFVIVTLMDHVTRGDLDGRTRFERGIYLAKATIRTSSQAPARQAAARIHELLDQTELDLTAAGYTPMVCRQIERWHPPPERDPKDQSTWQQAGGQYEVMSYPT